MSTYWEFLGPGSVPIPRIIRQEQSRRYDFSRHGDFVVAFVKFTATAANILAHESLYRFGGAADLIGLACDTAVALIFYELFKPVNRSLSLLAAFFRLMFIAIMAANTLNHFAPLGFLGGSHDLSIFTAAQLRAEALVSLRLHALGYNICLVFFGLTCLLLGYLIFRSTFLPRIVGVFIAIAGVGYLINSFVHFLAPAFGANVFRYILVPCGIGEFVLIVWLLVVGVNSQRWREQASTAGAWQ
jgi:hypothetical protein